jgi:acetoin utilization deacetylase AcuC-like enzyme
MFAPTFLNDSVLIGRNRNAFCLVRPPGHHAGINGLLEGGESCGFCIFNNVAAGALHAIADDKLSCNRCAIVDIDVHHGNGTEEIVRRFNDPSKLFFFSIHLFDNDRKTKPGSQSTYKFYPGTGDEDELALNIINVPIVPLWKDPTPMDAAGKTHNTRKKTKVDYGSLKTDGSSLDGMDGVDYSMDAAVAVAAEAAAAVANDASPVYTGRQAYRQAIQNRLLPALRAFDPDLIMISAGFDACKGDVGNARHERGGEKIGLDLEPDDYAWTTRRILEIADICCQGRVVSVLEGGYGRSARDGLDRTGFGSAAIQHLHSLIDPYDSENRFTNP